MPDRGHQIAAADYPHLREFWAVYGPNLSEIQQATRLAALDDPHFGPLVAARDASLDEEMDRAHHDRLRRAIEEGDWEGFFRDLEAQGLLFEGAGIPLSSWYGMARSNRHVALQYLVTELGSSPRRLASAVEGMSLYFDLVLQRVSEQYLKTP